MNKKLLIIVLTITAFSFVKAQDTLISTSNTILIGEIKEMDKGVISIETDFSDSDFKISWLKIKEIKSQRNFRFILSNQERYYGTISMKGDKIDIQDEEKGDVFTTTEDLVYIKQVEKGSFLDVLNLSLDLGYSYTNANSLEQINSNINADYYTKIGGVSGFFNTVQSTQDNVASVKRTEGGFGAKVFARYGLFVTADANFYSNNEQNMGLRSNYSLSIGEYFIRTNRIYFNSSIGLAYLNENYIPDTLTDRKSYEAKITMEYNMFDVGDLNLYSKLDMFPSFTEKGRLRTLFSFNAKYDLPRDFYIKAGLNYNYDNKPAEGVDPNDYVYTFGIGWEL